MEKPRSCILQRVPGVSKGKNEQQTYRKSSINPPSQISPLSLTSSPPPIFQRKKVDKPPLSFQSSFPLIMIVCINQSWL